MLHHLIDTKVIGSRIMASLPHSYHSSKGSTLALRTRKSGWSGVACALHCSTSCMYRNYRGERNSSLTTEKWEQTHRKVRHKLCYVESGMTDVMGFSIYKLRRVMGVIQVESDPHNSCICLQEVKTMCSPSAVCVSDSTPSTMEPYLYLQCMCGGDERVKWGWLSTIRAWSLSSSWATSLPQACAILLPATRLPTIIEAGPTSVQHNHIHQRHHACQWS